MQKQQIAIDGMTCGHCVARVRAALEAVPGVKVETVTVGKASVEVDEGAVAPGAVAAAIEDAGYDVISTEAR